MAINTTPVFTKKGDIQWTPAAVLAANVAKDGTGAVATVFTAGADGAFLQRLVARPLGTNVASVLRIFVNNGASNTTALNNSLIAEMTLPATTLSEVAAQPTYELPLGFALPAGFKINCTLGTAVASGFAVAVIGGNYTDA